MSAKEILFDSKARDRMALGVDKPVSYTHLTLPTNSKV